MQDLLGPRPVLRGADAKRGIHTVIKHYPERWRSFGGANGARARTHTHPFSRTPLAACRGGNELAAVEKDPDAQEGVGFEAREGSLSGDEDKPPGAHLDVDARQPLNRKKPNSKPSANINREFPNPSPLAILGV